MSAALSFEERLVEAVGPIVVKEVRQGLRAKVFAITFALLLLGCLLLALVATAEAGSDPATELGKRYFALFLGGLGALEFFVIPFTAFRGTVRERDDETWVLLALTGLGGRRIVRGKVASALAQGLLYASACAPFVLFSYYLNGVSIPTLLLALGLTFGWTVFLVALGVALGTQADSRRGRAASTLFAIALLGLLAAGGIAFAALLADEGERLLREDDFLALVGLLFALSLSGAWLLVEGAAACLALPSEAASRWPRIALAVQVVVGCALGALALGLLGGNKQVAAVGSVLTSLLLVFAGTFAISERDGYPRSFAARPGWLRPGAVRSYLLVLVLLAVSTATWVSLYPSLKGGDWGEKALHTVLAAPAYVALYLSLGVVLGRATPLRLLGEPLATRFAMFGCVTCAAVLGPVAGLVLGGSLEDKTWNLFNPLLGLTNFAGRLHEADGASSLFVLLVATAVAVVVAWAVLAWHDGARGG